MSARAEDFEAGDTLVDGAQFRLVRGRRRADGTAVILKNPPRDLAAPEAARGVARERELLTRYPLPGVVEAVDDVEWDGRASLVLRDVDAVPLASMVGPSLDPDAFLAVMIPVVRAVATVHAAGLAHLGLTPETVFVDPARGEAHLLHFVAASEVGREEQDVVPAHALLGNLTYISPEQTGRMNCGIDARADLYSLGVMAFELLSGAPPFRSRDPLELVHAHLARRPPRLVVPACAVLADVVVHLLAKAPIERYQTADGLLADLEAVRDARAAGDASPEVVLGAHDAPPRLVFPDALYGRADELGALRKAFASAAAGTPTLALISGTSGIGKSAVVREVQPDLVEQRARFATGKFEDLKRDHPYVGWAGAFGDLVRQILTHDEATLAVERVRLTEHLGPNARLVVDVAPDLALLMGEQPEPPPLAGPAAENRFRLAMQGFVDALATDEAPLVVFLDDLQWADPASLALVTAVLAARRSRVLLVGAYRDDEVDAVHPLHRMLQEADTRGLAVERLHLGPLATEDVVAWLSDALQRTQDDVAELARLVHRKTGGNPFFVRQLVEEIERAGHFVRVDGVWSWDIEAVRRWRTSDNVVELVAGRIAELPAEVLEVVQVAACLGFEIDVGVIAAVLGRPETEVDAAVVVATREGLVRTVRSATGVRRQFLHDRVQQAAYGLVSAEQRTAWHLAIGRVLEARPDADPFDVVDQLDEGREALTDPADRRELAARNHEVGRRALASAAGAVAARYLVIALELEGLTAESGWDGEAWDTRYDVVLPLATDAARAAWTSGDGDAFDQLTTTIVARARDLLDAVPAYELRIQRASDQTAHAAALEVGREVLGRIGWHLPAHPGQLAVVWSMLKVRWLLGRRTPEDFEDLPEMTDPVASATMRVMNSLMAPAYFADGDALALLIFKMVELSVRYGNAPASSYGWNNYGFVLSNILGDYEKGHAFSTSALATHDRTRTGSRSSSLLFSYNTFIRHWREPTPDTFEMYDEAHEAGKATGDLSYAGLSLQMHALARLLDGEPLPALRTRMEGYDVWLARVGQPQQRRMTALYRQVVLNLQGEGASVLHLAGPVWDEAEMVPILEAAEDRTALGAKAISELILAVIVGDHARASAVRGPARDALEFVPGTLWVPSQVLFDALVATWPGQPADLRAARKARKQLALWAKHQPRNQAHRVALVEAEILRARGNPAAALARYEEAARLARDTGSMLHELGLIAERATVAAEALGASVVADAWRREARRAYRSWGATVKLSAADRRRSVDVPVDLDVVGLLRASQAVGREIRLDRLLERITRLVCETAGAERVTLLFEEDGALRVQARGGVDEHVDVLTGEAMTAEVVPTSIVQYVARTREAVILADAEASGRFAHDPYVQARSPRSVLCAPLLNQGRLAGVVYAENNLTVDAFRPERLQALSMLSTSAAGALDNARLVRDLEQLNRAYERFVPGEFLALLGKAAITDVDLGDHVERDMTVLFADIRSFTTISEQLTPRETFTFVNAYLSRMAPVIEAHGGVIDKYIGDAIMALFPGPPTAAFEAAVAMQDELARYNQERAAQGLDPVGIGTAVHTGRLMLGTIGMTGRMDGTVISDAVNLAARLEGLTRFYDVAVLASEDAVVAAGDDAPTCRLVDRVRAKGISRPVAIYQVLTRDDRGALRTREAFDRAVGAYFTRHFDEAVAAFDEVLAEDPTDPVAAKMRARAQELLTTGVPADWDGVHTMRQK